VSRAPLLVLGVVALGLVGPVAPADAQTPDNDIQILNVAEGPDHEVTLEIAIPPTIGQLEPVGANFGVTENGNLLDLEVAPISSMVDVVVVLDTSGSMRGQALRAARSAAAGFIEQLSPEARVGVIGFGDTATVRAIPDRDRAAALDAVEALQAGGETALWDALALAADVVDGLGSDHPYVIVLADGANSAGSVSQDQAVARLRDVGAGLYAIAIDSPDTDRASLEETVAAVSGQFFATQDITQLDDLYVDIANRLASRYQLSFRSQSDAERSIVVSVAADAAVATARTTLAPTGAVDRSAQTPAPVLNVPDHPELGPVVAEGPGLLGGTPVLIAGLAIMFLAFVLLALLVTVPATRVRLDSADRADRVAGLNSRVSAATDRFVARRDTEGELDGALDAAGINLRPGEFVLLSAVAVAVVSMAASLVGGLVAGGLAAVAGALVVYLYLSIRTSRRRRRFADQMTDALGIMAGGLRSGRGLPQAVELVADEAPSPMAEQFRRIVFEARVGRDLTTAMLSTASRMKNQDLEWVTRAVDINRELGGDLTEVLDNVADTIRDRRRVARQVQAMSAEGRATGWVLLALPFVMFLFLAWRNPEFVDLLVGTPLGRGMLIGAVVSMAAGYVWVRKLVNIKY
jgi:tight adherence protein B